MLIDLRCTQVLTLELFNHNEFVGTAVFPLADLEPMKRTELSLQVSRGF